MLLSKRCRVATHTLDLSGCSSLTALKITCDDLTSDLSFVRKNKLSCLTVTGRIETLDGLDLEEIVSLEIRFKTAEPEPVRRLNIEPLLRAHKLKKLLLVGVELENPSILDQLHNVRIERR